MPRSRPRFAVHRVHSVLIVDDYDDVRVALATLLSLHGFDVATARSAEDALRQFGIGLRPCTVLLDLRMPGMDGWALWQRMQADPELARIPVIIVSGDLAQRARARQLGVREFLEKPVKPTRILAAVERQCWRPR